MPRRCPDPKIRQRRFYWCQPEPEYTPGIGAGVWDFKAPVVALTAKMMIDAMMNYMLKDVKYSDYFIVYPFVHDEMKVILDIETVGGKTI